MNSFTEKTIKITVFLRDGEFGQGNNTVVYEGLPTQVNVSKTGEKDGCKADVVISNIKLDTARQMTMLAFRKLQTYNNIIVIEAGTKGQQLNNVFQGEIITAVPVIGDANLDFKIEARCGYYPNLIPTPPVSVQGETTVEKLMTQFAKEENYDFENRGITMSVVNSVFAGSPVQKAQQLATQVGIDLIIDNRKFIIQPYETEPKGTIPLISKESGLIGYPSYTNDGVECSALYNPDFDLGGYFELKTILPHASGIWKIAKLEHKLSAYVPNGTEWETHLSGVWVQESKKNAE